MRPRSRIKGRFSRIHSRTLVFILQSLMAVISSLWMNFSRFPRAFASILGHKLDNSMANEFYSPGEQRAEKVGKLFATIARRYDLINDVQSGGFHRLWKRRLVRLANVQPNE